MGLSLGVFLISLGTFIALGAWLLDGFLNGFKYKIRRFQASKSLVLITIIFLIHVVGLVYTSDFSYALKDLKIKLPLLALPILFAGTPNLKESGRDWLIKIFILGLLVSTIISTSIILTNKLIDLREAMRFTSHIRIALMLVFAISLMTYLWREQNAFWQILFGLIIAWFIAFIYIAQLTTGAFILIIIGFFFALVWVIKNWKKGTARLVALGLLGSVVASFIYFTALHNAYFIVKDDLSQLEEKTALGEKYIHNLKPTYKENGHLLDIYFAPIELKNAWNERGQIDYNSNDQQGQKIKSTLKRYLSSKGFRKDAAGVQKLSEKDVLNIEMGKTNYLFDSWGPIERKFNELAFEWTAFQNNGDPSDNSFLMRTEFWRAGIGVFTKNPIFGVGTGDVKNELHKEYAQNGTLLQQKFWYRTHNQYLTFASSFGTVGLLVILYCLFFPIFSENKSQIYIAFVLIWAMSFLTEDTLETQVGATFYAFFSSFFLTQKKKS